MRYDVVDSLSWLFADSKVRKSPSRRASLLAPRGARPGFLVLIDGGLEGTRVRVGSKGLRDLDGHRLRTVVGSLLHSVPVEYNTGEDGFTARNRPAAKGVSRQAPFRCFDVLEPIEADTRTWNGDPAAVYGQVPVPRTTRAGVYTGEVEISAGDDTVTVPIKLEVSAFCLPARSSLSLTTHYNTDKMASAHGLELWSRGHWRMIRQYAELMVAYRHDTFRTPLNLVGSERDKGGRWSFDFRRLERLIRTMLDAGMTQIEGGHIGSCAQLLPTWRTFLERRGWHGMLCQHVSDEPTEAAMGDFTAGACAVRKYLPGVPILEPVEFPHLGAGVDWWVPKIDHYERDRELYEAHRSHGDRIWCYTCCKPGGRYMNRLMDFPLLRTRLLPWGCAKYDISGYLHWALNNWPEDRPPFEYSVGAEATLEPDGTHNDLPAGDRYIIYPGPNGPWSSMRFEAQREGWEDHAMLMAARKRLGPERFERWVSKTVRGFADFTDDVAVFRRQYRALLNMVSE